MVVKPSAIQRRREKINDLIKFFDEITSKQIHPNWTIDIFYYKTVGWWITVGDDDGIDIISVQNHDFESAAAQVLVELKDWLFGNEGSYWQKKYDKFNKHLLEEKLYGR